MYFSSKYYNDTMVFKVTDVVLSDLGIIQYKRGLASALSKQKVKNIIIDFERVKINNSDGLKTVLFAKRYTEGKGGKCSIVSPKPKVVSCMKKAGILNLFDIVSDKKEYQEIINDLSKVEKVKKPISEDVKVENKNVDND
ncbi:MAG: hypothetical protein U9N76_07350 [Candidatus Marinimicrobia bacterium]|nr:hypothetical protein [Candidatus Neomarinimicrobiota bacterium]